MTKDFRSNVEINAKLNINTSSNSVLTIQSSSTGQPIINSNFFNYTTGTSLIIKSSTNSTTVGSEIAFLKLPPSTYLSANEVIGSIKFNSQFVASVDGDEIQPSSYIISTAKSFPTFQIPKALLEISSSSVQITGDGDFVIGSTSPSKISLVNGAATLASASITGNLTASIGTTTLGVTNTSSFNATAASVGGNRVTTNNIIRGTRNSPIGSVETFDRTLAQTGLGPTSSTAYFTFFTPTESINASSITFWVNNAGASIIFFRLGLYSVSNSDQYASTASLVARTASITAFTSSFTTGASATLALDTTGGYPASFTLNAGSRYAVAFLCVASTTVVGPVGFSNNQTAMAALPPRMNGASAAQRELATTYSASTLSAIALVPWFRLTGTLV